MKQIAEQYAEQIWSKRDLKAIEQWLHPDVILHTLLGEYRGHEAMRKVIEAWLKGFPDLKVENTATIADGERVAIQWKAHGTHTGPFKNIAPTGKPIRYEGISLYKIRDGKITEYWGYIDMHHLLNQLS